MKKSTKTLAFLLSMATACTAFASMPVSAAQVVLGDVNSDGKVSISDVVLLTRYTNEENIAICLENADFNCDGILSAADTTVMLRKIARLDEVQADDAWRYAGCTAGVRIAENLLTTTLEKGGKSIAAALSQIEMTDEETGLSIVYDADDTTLDKEFEFLLPNEDGLTQDSKKNITVSLHYRVDEETMQKEGITFEDGGNSFVGKTYSVQLTTAKKGDAYRYYDAYWMLDGENVSCMRMRSLRMRTIP